MQRGTFQRKDLFRDIVSKQTDIKERAVDLQRNNVNMRKLMRYASRRNRKERVEQIINTLARSGCPFLFKGGSSLMLHLNTSKRLSIDIDIICPPGTVIENYLNLYAQEYGFGKVAYSTRLLAKGFNKIRHYNPDNLSELSSQLLQLAIPTKLNKLKRTHPEAFFYWNEIQVMEQQL